MNSVDAGLSAKSLAEVALLASRVGRDVIDGRLEPPNDSLRSFWQNSRSIQRNLESRLDHWTIASDPLLHQLAEIAISLFTTEMLTRVWSTVLSGLDRQNQCEDLTRIARNAVGGLLQVRHGLMSRLLQLPASDSVAEVERLRRRSDRWTDLLIGNLCGHDEYFEFSFDVERARDFAQESIDYDPMTGPHPVEHLMAAGLRMAFLGQLPERPIEEPAYLGIVQAILGGLPPQAFHQDGSLRTVLERRLTATHLREKSLPSLLLDSDQMGSPSNPTAPSDAPASTGISFSRIRRRPK